MNLLQRIEPHTRNGIVSLKSIRRSNYALYKVLLHPDTAPLIQGLELLNDVRRVRELDEIRKFLQFNFNNIVDITRLRKHHLDLYKYLSDHGGVQETIMNLGFQYKYSSREINLPNDTKSRAFHNKLYYESKRLGMTVKELRRELGLEVKEIDKDQILELQRAGFSYKKIADYLCISKTHVWRLVNEDRR